MRTVVRTSVERWALLGSDLNNEFPQQLLCFEHISPSWWCWFCRLWQVEEAAPGPRQQVTKSCWLLKVVT